MAVRMFKLICNRPGYTPVRVGQAGGNYSWISGGFDAAAFGAPSIQPRLSDPNNVDEFTRLASAAQVRTFPIEVRVQGTSENDLATKIDTLLEAVSEINAWGGRIRYRAENMSNAVDLIAIDVQADRVWSHSSESHNRQTVVLTITCQPWAYPDPLRVIDNFAADVLGTGGKYNDDGADYTTVASMALAAAPITNMVVAANRLTHPNNLTTELRLLHTGTKWTYADPYVRMQYYYGDLAPTKIGTIVKWVDKDNYIEAYHTGALAYKVDVILAGVRTTRITGTIALSRHALQIITCMRGNTIYGSVPARWDDPEVSDTAQYYTLSTAEAAVLGAGIAGRCGIVSTPGAGNTTAQVREFEAMEGTIQPKRTFTAGVNDSNANEWASTAIPTSASTVFKMHIDSMPTGANAYIGWWNRPRSHNLMPSDFLSYGTVAIIAGVQAAAGTALSQDAYASPREPGANTTVIGSTGAADAGAMYYLGGQLFRKGVTYRARVLARRVTGSGNIVIKLGVNGDIATSVAAAPATNGWTVLTVDWTPTATRYGAYFGSTTAAAVAGTWGISEHAVWDTTNSPATPNGYGGFLPYGKMGAAGSRYLGTGGTIVAADSNAYGGGDVVRCAAGQTSASLTLRLSGEAIDEPTGECLVDFYAVVRLSTTVTSLTLLSLVGAANGFSAGLEPYGSTAKPVTINPSFSTWRIVYLGRGMIPAGVDSPSTFSLVITKSSAGDVDVSYIMGMPVRSSIAPPSGVDDAVGNAPTPQLQIDPDLTAYEKRGGIRIYSRWGGSALKLQRKHRIECCMMAMNYGADNPNLIGTTNIRGGTTAVGEDFMLRFEVQPRTYLLEGLGA